MKNIGLYFLLIIFFLSCKTVTEQKSNLSITGKFKNTDGEVVTIYKRTPYELIPIDSVKLDVSGSFKFNLTAEQKDFYLLNVKKDYDIVLLIDTAEVVEITADMKDIKTTYSVSGSIDSRHIQLAEQKLFETKKIVDSISIIYQKYLGTPGFDTIKEQLDVTFIPILNQQKKFSKDFIDANPTSLVNLIIISQYITPNAPVLDMVEDANYYYKVDSILTAIYPNSPHIKKLNSIVANMKKNTKSNLTTEGKITIGGEAPDFTLTAFDGTTIKISSLRKKYLLLYFWASWSKPCIADLENIKKIFWAYYPNLQLVLIALDQNEAIWREAINKYELKYFNATCDFKTWTSPVVREYGVKTLPSTVLISPEGNIVVINLFEKNLDNKLRYLLHRNL